MNRTQSQTEWAERIEQQVNDEFDPVVASFRTVAERQIEKKRIDTEAIIAILGEKRAEIMNRDQAGYFIQEWQEISNQVQKIMRADARYQTIRAKWAAKVAAKT